MPLLLFVGVQDVAAVLLGLLQEAGVLLVQSLALLDQLLDALVAELRQLRETMYAARCRYHRGEE